MMMYGVDLQAQLGGLIRQVAAQAVEETQPLSPAAALYCEKREGFQCGTCCYVTPVNATHGRCAVVAGTVHLAEGCCALWDADTAQLHLYRSPGQD